MTYDCFMYNGEADILEIRLNILNPYVDFFVLCEAKQTFSGKHKPLYYAEDNGRFLKWAHKIIRIEPNPIQTENAFERAAFQKDFIRAALGSIARIDGEDKIYYGDVDEIWTPQTEEGKLEQLNYSYFLNNRSSEKWQGTNICLYKNLYDLNKLRANHDKILPNGGWHFTNMGGAEEVRRKLESYDHQEFNNDGIKSLIEERIRNGEDYVGRSHDWQGKPFEFWIDETDLPQYLKDNKEQWTKLFR